MINNLYFIFQIIYFSIDAIQYLVLQLVFLLAIRVLIQYLDCWRLAFIERPVSESLGKTVDRFYGERRARVKCQFVSHMFGFSLCTGFYRLFSDAYANVLIFYFYIFVSQAKLTKKYLALYVTSVLTYKAVWIRGFACNWQLDVYACAHSIATGSIFMMCVSQWMSIMADFFAIPFSLIKISY